MSNVVKWQAVICGPHYSLSIVKVQSQPSFIIYLLGEFSGVIGTNNVQEKIRPYIFVRHNIYFLFGSNLGFMECSQAIKQHMVPLNIFFVQ